MPNGFFLHNYLIKYNIISFPYSKHKQMAPNAIPTRDCTGVLNENDAETIDGDLVTDIAELKKANKRHLVLVWRNIILFVIAHLMALYGAYLTFTSAKLYTLILGMSIYINKLIM